MRSQFALLKYQRFGPFFITQLLGAFNDNLFKTLVSVLIAYGLFDIGDQKPETLVAMAAGLFVVPFVLFTPLAGDITDKFDKSRIMRLLKITEILIVGMAIAGLYLKSVPFVLFVVFLLGTQSAFFSPGKFAIMPQHLARDELIAGNALVNTGTYLAILIGTLFGSALALSSAGVLSVTVILIICALIGYVMSRAIPEAPPQRPDLKLSFNPALEAWRIIVYAKRQPRGVFPALISVSWFFFIGTIYLTQFPNYARQTLGADNMVLTFFMAVFSIGVAIGGLLNNRLLKSEVKATFVPLSALLIALFSADLYFASQPYADVAPKFKDANLMNLTAFLSNLSGWRIVMDLLLISMAGGLYAVPLKAIIQDRTPRDHSARVMAGSALMDALFVLLAAVVGMVAFSKGFAVEDLFLMVSVLSVFVTLLVAHFMSAPLLGFSMRKTHI